MVVRLIPYRTAIGLVKQARCDILPRPKWRQELDQPSTHNDRTSTNPLLQDRSSLLGLTSLQLLNHWKKKMKRVAMLRLNWYNLLRDHVHNLNITINLVKSYTTAWFTCTVNVSFITTQLYQNFWITIDMWLRTKFTLPHKTYFFKET